MTKEKHVLTNFQEFEEPENVAQRDGRVVKALGSGRVHMNMLFPGIEAKKAVLYDVLYVPKLTFNLFSVRAAVAKGNAVEFVPKDCCIWDENGKCLAGKMCRKPFPTVGEIRSTRKLQLVHRDVCGPMQRHSIGGAKYFVTFIDEKGIRHELTVPHSPQQNQTLNGES